MDLYAIVDVLVIEQFENLYFLHDSLEFFATLNGGVKQFVPSDGVDLVDGLAHLVGNISRQYRLFLFENLDHLRVMQGSFHIFILSDE